ncbi:unnamed protein product [Periconia digitata]|uniref:Uncharacterized protein n=1 Tax=Periconia digitata TaxID=1303443 RepID=A0A9W4XQ95_9PLEO|nr:unnamed protein product [Periconia digitata]
MKDVCFVSLSETTGDDDDDDDDDERRNALPLLFPLSHLFFEKELISFSLSSPLRTVNVYVLHPPAT